MIINKPLILIVDDIEINRTLLARVLGGKNYEIVFAEGGRQALELIQQQAFDLVLLDVMMPEIDGFEVLEGIRKQFLSNKLPVIMVTALDDRQEIVKALKLGASDYVTKPFSAHEVRARVNTHLQISQLFKAVKLSEDRYALAFSATNDGLMDWDLSQSKIFFSERWLGMIGSEDSQKLQTLEDWLALVHPHDVDILAEKIQQLRDNKIAQISQEYRALNRDGSYHWMLFFAKSQLSEQGVVLRICGSQSDITQTKIYDPITGLPNPVILMDRLERLLANRHHSDEDSFAVLIAGINNKEKLFSVLGSVGFDQLNTLMVERLNEVIRKEDYLVEVEDTMVSRLSDSHFVILQENMHKMESTITIGERLQTALTQAFYVFEMTVFCEISVGIIFPDEEKISADEMVKRAMHAESLAQQAGFNNVRIYNAEQHGNAIEKLQLENQLRDATASNELRAVYQPIVDLQADNKVIGTESLVRWQHPQRGFLSPFFFIEVAEEIGVICHIGEWMFRETCRQYVEWGSHSDGFKGFMSVNVSVQQLNESFVIFIEETLKNFAIPVERVHLEITESIFLGDIEKTIKFLLRLKALGLYFAIDDFGTGYSSLAYLIRLPVSYLKIDKSFVDGICADERAAELVQTIIQMGHGLHMKIIAEGIETQDQADKLKAMGCDQGQGYLFSRPVVASECESLFLSD